MIIYREMRATDFNDVAEMCRDIWDGADYLPQLFHQWLEAPGFFMAAVEQEANKVIGTGKFSVLSDGTGWLEGLRVHEDYRGMRISNKITDLLLELAKKELAQGKIERIAYSTHTTSSKSIHLMEERGFKLKQSYITVFKNFNDLDKGLKIEEFDVKEWQPEYEEFKELPYIKRRNNLLPIAFVFQRPTLELYNSIKKDKGFMEINGVKGIYKYKGEPNFLVVEESMEAIETFAKYYGLKHKGVISFPPLTTVLQEDKRLLEDLRKNDYTVWCDWNADYLYYEYEV